MNPSLYEAKRREALEGLRQSLHLVRALHPSHGRGPLFLLHGDELRRRRPSGPQDQARQAEADYRAMEHVLAELLRLIEQALEPTHALSAAVAILSRSRGPIERLGSALEVYRILLASNQEIVQRPPPHTHPATETTSASNG